MRKQLTRKQAKDLLHRYNLRATAPRLAVIALLAEHGAPLSYSEVLERLGKTEWDPATIYRNLVKLTEVGIAWVVSRAEGMARYALVVDEPHQHSHFVCEDCGRVSCLPATVTASVDVKGPWGTSLRTASVQFRGECPDCLEAKG